ncbi:MAG: molybdopterin biosynthesis protein [Proteobacteria bacterium]|nr:molybdopterin biosynthesis protein [Pseudomonadota bacterium]
MKRNVYLKMMPLDQARAKFLEAFDWAALAGTEVVPTSEALGRVTAQVVLANYSSPSYHAAAMDGIAVKASDTYGASQEHPLTLEMERQAFWVNTGHPLPPGCNAVVMVEQVHHPREGQAEIRAAAFPWQHVRRVGEDIVSQELMLGHHHRLSPADVAALLTSGVFELEVLARPKVAIIPTGLELVDWREARENPPAPGAIMETNSLFLAGLVRQAGGEPLVMERVTDDFEAIKQAVAKALAGPAHMVVLNAGASAGSKDYSAHVINDLGQVLVHGVTVMPGKPSILGQAQGKPVVGSPGYPVSAWVCFDQFIGPALAAMQGQPAPGRETIEVVPARGLASKLGREEFLRVHLGRVSGKVVATPLKRGAGTITSLTRADGLLRIPADSEGLEEGQPAVAELLGPRERVENTLVVVGSHDVTLDLLGDHLKRLDPNLHLSSSHLGSLAGLMAIKSGRCHLGGTHLLDPDTGEYNVSYLRRYLKGVPVRLVTLALRQQGLMVKPGNPKGIKTLADLGRQDVVLVNRQAGSGTRVLLDYHLKKLGLDPGEVRGYDQEEYTHMAVAVQVLAGGADVGLGILAAAKALGLEFIPVMEERYDLCIPQAHWDDHRVAALRQVLAAPEFREQVKSLGGYDVTPMGTIAWEG